MTTEPNDSPTWLTIGADVAIIERPHWGEPAVSLHKVVKLTKRDIVLSNDVRFRHDQKQIAIGNEVFYRLTGKDAPRRGNRDLYAADSDAEAQARRDRLRYRAQNAAEKASHNLTVEKADAAIAALQAWKEVHTAPQ